MTTAIGRNTMKGRELKERFEHILGLAKAAKEMAGQLKGLKLQQKEAIDNAGKLGFNVRVIKMVLREKLMEDEDRKTYYQTEFTFFEEVDLYRHALELIDDPDHKLRDIAQSIDNIAGTDLVKTLDEGEEMAAKVRARSRKKASNENAEVLP